MDGLTEADRAVLEFAGRWWRSPGAKEQAALDELGLSATQLAQALNRLADSPAAAVEAPMVTARLRRVRDERRRQRTTRRAS